MRYLDSPAVCGFAIFSFLSFAGIAKGQITETKLTAGDGAAADNLGISISVSGDYLLVGAYEDDDNGSDAGAAYIFHYDGTDWVEQAKLKANDGAAGDNFGVSVSVSGDYALIGADWDDDNGTPKRAAKDTGKDFLKKEAQWLGKNLVSDLAEKPSLEKFNSSFIPAFMNRIADFAHVEQRFDIREGSGTYTKKGVEMAEDVWGRLPQNQRDNLVNVWRSNDRRKSEFMLLQKITNLYNARAVRLNPR